ncbi:MAG TPA: 23S rRNA (guanosine(2251)-2'-O)-methyltransferase RlmB [Firmicutes bacterium]|nr:23S rRNA (guanosine(2251)-2'-O)-methyltransferase RlmB [Candidatus Fermentithermobacillaceae bacterium]
MDKGTKSQDYIEIFGKQPVHEALSGGWPVREVITRGQPQDYLVKSSVNLAKEAGVRVTVLEPPAFDRRFPRQTQGIAAVVRQVGFLGLDEILAGVPSGRQPFFLALDGIQDPHNLGALVRTAYAMGVDAVVIPRRRSAAIGEGAAKSSAGAIFRQPICQVPNIHSFTEWAKDRGLWVYGLDAGGKDSLWDTDLRGGVALIVGSEGKGLSHLVRERCDFLIRIPMVGRIGSLNASVACAMAIYEVRRQRERSNAVE